jgi:probable rRNA maturation factor
MEPPSRRPSPGDTDGTAIDIVVAEPAWYRLVPGAEAIVRRAARAAGMHATVVLAADRVVRRLNSRHRGLNKPTNVLTYERPAPEVILALGVIRAEAVAQGRRPAHHLAHLVVHAALHLQGQDHLHPGEARRMEMAEARILRGIGVPNPWKRS